MNIEIKYNEKYPPRHDLIFSIMFEEKKLFSQLLKAVTGHTIETDEIISQASLIPDNINESYIRFDTYAKDKDGTVYSMDLQNTYIEELLKNRTIYYACRALSGQKIIKGDYKKFNKVVVSFIMTKKKMNQPVEIISLYNQNNERYSDLLTLYNVYVPSVIAVSQSDDDLKVFSEFFSVNSFADMEKFYSIYHDNALANELIVLYNKTIGYTDLDNLAGKEYFKMKITEQDIAEAKVEYEAKGRAEGRIEGEAGLIRKLKNIGRSVREIADFCNMSETEVERLLAVKL